ncbi:MAG TPA: hypothetical protein VF789_29610 [Thermoanaerobaculia bacterium]
MSVRLSVADVLAHMEAQLARHKEQEAYHDGREVFHREQKALHAAEYENVLQHYEAFKAAAGAAVEIAARTASAPEPEPRELPELQPGRRIIRSRLVTRVMEEVPVGYTFGAAWLAEEVNRRYGQYLKKPANARLASAALRRKLAHGELRLAREGKAHREALYTKA